jgi:hypothetical protein
MPQDNEFRKRVAAYQSQKLSQGAGSNYLTLPAGIDDPKRFFFRAEKKGHYSLDILMYRVTADHNPAVKAGQKWYQRTIWVHFGIGPDERAVLCPKTIGQPCPICEERRRMEKEPDVDQEAVKALLPKERELFNVVDLSDPDAGVKVFEISHFLFGKKLEQEVAENPDDRSGFADLCGGKTLKLRFTEKTLPGRTFLEVDRIDFEDRGDYDEGWLDATHDLDAMLKVLPYAELQALFLQVDSAAAPAGDESTPAPARRTAPPPPAAPARKPAPTAPTTPPAKPPARRAPPPVVKAPPPPPADEVPADDAPTEEAPQPADGIPCPACNGTGQNSKGKPCYPCRGTGAIVEDVEPAPPPVAPPAPTRRTTPPAKAPPAATKTPPMAAKSTRAAPKAAPAPAAPSDGHECPGGGTFGDPASCDNLPACEACQNWPDCRSAADAQA